MHIKESLAPIKMTPATTLPEFFSQVSQARAQAAVELSQIARTLHYIVPRLKRIEAGKINLTIPQTLEYLATFGYGLEYTGDLFSMTVGNCEDFTPMVGTLSREELNALIAELGIGPKSFMRTLRANNLSIGQALHLAQRTGHQLRIVPLEV